MVVIEIREGARKIRMPCACMKLTRNKFSRNRAQKERFSHCIAGGSAS